MICQLSGLVGVLMPVVGNIGGPLVIWLIKKDELLEVDRHGKEALNFQISYMIYSAVIGTLAAILFVIVIGLFLLPLVFVVYLFTIIFPIIAGLKANEGRWYSYPMTIRFFK